MTPFRSGVRVCVLLISVAAVVDAEPATERRGGDMMIEKTEYHGWRDAWRIRNGTCEMVIVPQVGRVMYFGLTGGKNVLWNNDAIAGQVVDRDDHEWHNFGGDKVWPTQQDLWEKYTDRKGWPPPYAHDAAPTTSEQIPGGVRLTTQLSPEFGTRTVREFIMDPARPLVHIRQWHEKHEGKPIPMTVWNVTQVRKPRYALLPVASKRYKPLGEIKPELLKVETTSLSIRNDDQTPQKVGVAPDADLKQGWVAAVHENQLFVSSRRLVKDHYADDCCDEIYTAPARDGSYVELEGLSPLKELSKGEQLRDDMVWQLKTLGDAQAADPKQAAGAAQALHADALKSLTK